MTIERIEQIIEDMRAHAHTHGLLVRAEDLEEWADTLAEMLELLDLVDGTIVGWHRSEEVEDETDTDR